MRPAVVRPMAGEVPAESAGAPSYRSATRDGPASVAGARTGRRPPSNAGRQVEQVRDVDAVGEGLAPDALEQPGRPGDRGRAAR